MKNHNLQGSFSQRQLRVGELVKQKVFKTSGIELSWEIERVGNK